MECNFCQENINSIDYKNREVMRRFVTSQFKVSPSKRNKLCKKHQSMVSSAVKNARFMALLPYTRNQTVKK
jgi:small subunit ribosomal protein S18